MNTISKSLLAIFFATVFASCFNDFSRRIDGNGNIITVTRNLSSFEKVSSSGSFNIEIINDSTVSKVEIEAESNIIDVLQTEVRGNELEIEFKDNVCITTHKTIRIKVFTKKLSGISLSGSGNINTQAFTGDDFDARLSGSGDFTFDFTGKSIDYSISGSGTMTAKGKVTTQEIKVSGSGEIDALDLESENADIDISGSGKAKIFATKTLKAEISGSGDVYYKGTPAITTSISGSGKLKPW